MRRTREIGNMADGDLAGVLRGRLDNMKLNYGLSLIAFGCVVWFDREAIAPLIILVPIMLLSAIFMDGDRILIAASFMALISIVIEGISIFRNNERQVTSLWRYGLLASVFVFVLRSANIALSAATSIPFIILSFVAIGAWRWKNGPAGQP